MDERAMLLAIASAPGDDAIRLAYADWLEERGDARAEFIRLEEAARRLPIWNDSVWATRDRRRQLRANCEPFWLEALGYEAAYRPLFSAPLPDAREHRWRLFQELVETWHSLLTESDGSESVGAVEEFLGIQLPPAMREFYRLTGRWSHVLEMMILGALNASVDPPGIQFTLENSNMRVIFSPLHHEWMALGDLPVDDPPVISLWDDDLSCNTFSEFVLATWVHRRVSSWPHRKVSLFQFWPDEAMSPELGFGKCRLSTQHLGDLTLGEGPDVLMAHSVGTGELTIVARTPEALAGLPTGLR